MTETELRLAIDQVWAHTQKTAPGPQLEEAKQHLTHLRSVQADRASQGRVDYRKFSVSTPMETIPPRPHAAPDTWPPP